MRRFIDRHRITRFKPNPFFPVNTLTLMRGAIAARSLGVFGRYVDEMFRHMWTDPKKMDDPHVLRAAFEESGLDAERFFELVQTREIKDELLANTERSVARGTFGAPTFFVGDEIYFGKDRLRDVEERILALCSEGQGAVDGSPAEHDTPSPARDRHPLLETRDMKIPFSDGARSRDSRRP